MCCPTAHAFPKMQRETRRPVFASATLHCDRPNPPACGKFPMVVFSHGLGSNPVQTKSIDFLTRLASYGYIVAALSTETRAFRVSASEDLATLSIYCSILTAWWKPRRWPSPSRARSTSCSRASRFRAVVNVAQIGGVGGNLGGAGFIGSRVRKLPARIRAWPRVPPRRDPRVKAAGYVPYAGQRLLPAFGDDNATARNVSIPYLALSGTADTTAPKLLMEQAMNNFSRRAVVALEAWSTPTETAYANDVFGWIVPFPGRLREGDSARRWMTHAPAVHRDRARRPFDH